MLLRELDGSISIYGQSLWLYIYYTPGPRNNYFPLSMERVSHNLFLKNDLLAYGDLSAIVDQV